MMREVKMLGANACWCYKRDDEMFSDTKEYYARADGGTSPTEMRYFLDGCGHSHEDVVERVILEFDLDETEAAELRGEV